VRLRPSWMMRPRVHDFTVVALSKHGGRVLLIVSDFNGAQCERRRP
jgi:hypothetical protein